MSNNNLANCLRALEQAGKTGKILVTIGKNQKQATRLTFENGSSVSVSALYKVDEFLKLVTSHEITTSVATSKFNDVNEDEAIKEMSKWLSNMATYSKKCCYNYEENTLSEIIAWTMEDFGVTPERLKELHKNWDSEGWRAQITDDLIFCNGYFTPRASLRATIKQWLTAHEMYDHEDATLDAIINKYRFIKNAQGDNDLQFNKISIGV